MSSGSPSSAAAGSITITGGQSIPAGRVMRQAEPDTQELLTSLHIDADDPPYAALRALQQVARYADRRRASGST